MILPPPWTIVGLTVLRITRLKTRPFDRARGRQVGRARVEQPVQHEGVLPWQNLGDAVDPVADDRGDVRRRLLAVERAQHVAERRIAPPFTPSAPCPPCPRTCRRSQQICFSAT